LLLDAIRDKQVILKAGIQNRKVNFRLNVRGLHKYTMFMYAQKLYALLVRLCLESSEFNIITKSQ
jgi:hypothetical protein